MEDTILKYQNFMDMMTPKFGKLNSNKSNLSDDWKLSDNTKK